LPDLFEPDKEIEVETRGFSGSSEMLSLVTLADFADLRMALTGTVSANII
jgi:hypothetical protein